jgi:hypothetical protein
MRFGTWGIFVLSLWAMALAFVAIAQLLILSTTNLSFDNPTWSNQAAIWLIFSVNAFFFFGFSSSAYGLLRRHNWGRIIFLWTVIIWSSYRLAGLFVPFFYANQNFAVGQFMLDALRYAVGLVLPLWYLNLPHIKMIFYDHPLEDSTFEETTADDHLD